MIEKLDPKELAGADWRLGKKINEIIDYLNSQTATLLHECQVATGVATDFPMCFKCGRRMG